MSKPILIPIFGTQRGSVSHSNRRGESAAIETIRTAIEARAAITQASAEQDDALVGGELTRAAMCCLCPPGRSEFVQMRRGPLVFSVPRSWNLAPDEWGPVEHSGRITQLARAGAYIVAEIERLQRIESRREP